MFSILLKASGLAGLLTLVGCSNGADCLVLRDYIFDDADRITELARTLNIAVTEPDALFMVGAAKALNQIERADVSVCLRPANDGKAEYRLVADTGEVMEWRTTPTLTSPAR
jgi:hypothetical protein